MFHTLKSVLSEALSVAMENRAHALVAGLFMILLGIASVAAFWWLGHPRQAVNRYILETGGNVTGLNMQAPVRYRGIRAGRVEDITTDDKNPRLILVTISLDRRFKLTRGTTAQLNTQGITGLAYVELEDDGSDPVVLTSTDDQLPRIALQPSLLDQLGSHAGDIAAQASEVALRLNRLLDDRNLHNLSRSLDNIAAASEGLKQLPPVIASLNEALSEANIKRLTATLARLDEASGEAAPLARDLRAMVQKLTVLAGRLDQLTGAAGGELTGTTLPRVNALVSQLSENSHQLSRLLDNIERNPQSLLFGRGAPTPGPGEAGFTAPAK
jgi:phospholipid/cholesterol/gamma-HCH transport system substrate-binding protein